MVVNRSPEHITPDAASPPRVPLHLNAAQPMLVERDGPALRVRSAGHATALYPLARIARVVARGRVQWRSEALSALMEAGIPVVLLGKDGMPKGYCWPADRPAVPFAAELAEFLDRPDWNERYHNWLRSARMRILLRWAANREGNDQPVPKDALRELARRHIYLQGLQQGPSGNALLHGALAAMVASHLSRAGLAPAYWGWGGGRLDLVGDITSLLEFALELELGTFGEGIHGDQPAILRMLSPEMARLPHRCIDILGGFARWVRETLDTWH